MPQVEIDSHAVADIDQIYDFIAIENQSPQAATRFIRELHSKFNQYAHQPEMGEPRDDLDEALRSFTFKNHYVVVYRPLEDGIDVLRVIHGARDYPTLFGDG